MTSIVTVYCVKTTITLLLYPSMPNDALVVLEDACFLSQTRSREDLINLRIA